MHRLVILASIVVLAAASANCSGSANPLGPSAVSASGDDVNGSQARPSGGGGGGGKGGKPGSGGSGTLALVMVVDNGNGVPNWGEKITFNVTSTASSPFVGLNCYQGSTQVYGASVGFFDGYPWEKAFFLSSGGWTGGAATCTATLYTSVDGTSTTTLATLNFNVGA